MSFNFYKLLAVGISSLYIAAHAKPIDEGNFHSPDIIERDIAIIGGGATGTYAAVRLGQDLNQTVIVVERKKHLGGHVNTYIDPDNGFPIDYGVEAYDSLPAAITFFQRFQINVAPEGSIPFVQKSVDFNTGTIIPGSAPDYTQALETYAGLVQKYASLAIGYSQLQYPVAPELLEPFGQFIQTYNLSALVPIIWQFAYGVGDLTTATTLDVLQLFGSVQLNDLIQGTFLVAETHDNSVLYQEAAALLGSNVLYDSVVIDSQRGNGGPIALVVQTPTGRKLIKAKKLLITIPTTLSNMQPFNLDWQETSVFSQWLTQNNYVAVINKTGLPDDFDLVNVDPTQPYGLPKVPFVTAYDFTGDSGHFKVSVLGDDWLSAGDAKNLILDGLANIRKAKSFNVTQNPEIDAFSAHVPLQLHVSPQSIKNGFYKDLYALQGHRNTFYTGAGWASDYSSVLWQFTEGLLPAIVA